MVARKSIEQIVWNSGLWDGGGKYTHKFLLSPDVFEISEERRQELEVLGVALYKCFAGLSRITAITNHTTLWRGKNWKRISRAFRAGVPKTHRRLQMLSPTRVPFICKVDLLQGTDGKFYIAEIDGHNKHGLGYSALTARVRRMLCPEANHFPGVAFSLARTVRRLNPEEGNLVLLYAEQERFYLPEFQILKDELTKEGIDLIVVSESEVRVKDGQPLIDGRAYRLFMDLPFLFHHPSLNTALEQLYREKAIDFVIPPKPFFGSKNLMGVIRNEGQHPEIEAILRSQMGSFALETLRDHLPETYLIDNRRNPSYYRKLCQKDLFVLKAAISSGMKGVSFSEEPSFEGRLEQAFNSRFCYVLQSEIENALVGLRYFPEKGRAKKDQWYTRITVHYAIEGIADIVVTARRDKRVHGAKDCLQLGTVIV